MSGMVALLAGLANGYAEGRQRNIDNERKAKMAQIAQDQNAAQKEEGDRMQADQAKPKAPGLADPSAAVLDTGDSPPATDLVPRARDVQVTPAQPGPMQSFVKEAEPVSPVPVPAPGADVTMANTIQPQATPELAAPAAPTAARQPLPLGGLQLGAAQRRDLDARVNAKVDEAVTAAGGNIPNGLAKMLTDTQLTGNAKFEARAGKDGKGTIVRVGEDGAETPFTTYDNTVTGHAALLANLARMSPQTKISYLHEQHKIGPASAQAAHANTTNTANTGAQVKYPGQQPAPALAAASRQATAAGATAGKPSRLGDDDALQLNNANAEVKAAENRKFEALKLATAGGEESPALKYANEQLARAMSNQFDTRLRLGLITPQKLASDAMTAATSPDDIAKTLAQLPGRVGKDMAGQVEGLMRQSPAWEKFYPAKPPAPALASPPGVQRGPMQDATARPATPVDVAGAKLDQARLNLSELMAGKRPGLAAGRAALNAFADRANAARDAVRQAEAQYQAELGPQSAYIGRRPQR